MEATLMHLDCCPFAARLITRSTIAFPALLRRILPRRDSSGVRKSYCPRCIMSNRWLGVFLVFVAASTAQAQQWSGGYYPYYNNAARYYAPPQAYAPRYYYPYGYGAPYAAPVPSYYATPSYY